MKIKVHKKNLAGDVKYQYEGELLSQDEHEIVVDALFDRADMPFMNVVFKKGDRFVEYYFTDRWYNIYTIHDRDDGNVKGWYCNVSKPATLEDDIVSFVDLALDLWVARDGKQTVLDEDEFEKLDLEDELRIAALRGLDELKNLFLNNEHPS
jgi:predicted RNA-binding protein associated with RNAse of E/G family